MSTHKIRNISITFTSLLGLLIILLLVTGSNANASVKNAKPTSNTYPTLGIVKEDLPPYNDVRNLPPVSWAHHNR